MQHAHREATPHPIAKEILKLPEVLTAPGKGAARPSRRAPHARRDEVYNTRLIFDHDAVCHEFTPPVVRPALPKAKLVEAFQRKKQMQFDARRVPLSPTPPALPKRYVLQPFPPTASSVELRRWLSGGWKAETHRHHEAATTVQCAYRRWRAVCITNQARLADLTQTTALLRNEDSLEQQSLAGVPFVLLQPELRETLLQAVRTIESAFAIFAAEKLRRGKQANREAARHLLQQEHAATQLQRIVRGRASRREVQERREGDPSEAGFAVKYSLLSCEACGGGECGHVGVGYRRKRAAAVGAAEVIQRQWRGADARTELEVRRRARRLSDASYHHGLKHAAACTIQRWTRAHTEHAKRVSLRTKAYRATVLLEATELLQRQFRRCLAIIWRRRGAAARAALIQHTLATEAAVMIQKTARMMFVKKRRGGAGRGGGGGGGRKRKGKP